MANELPRRSAIVQLIAVFGSFAAGPLIGSALASGLAPDSQIAGAVGIFALPLAWMAGLWAWFGLGVVHAIGRLLLWVFRRESRVRLASLPPEVPRGYGAFVPVSALAGAIAGVATGLVASVSFAGALLAWLVAGIAYGFALRALAAGAWLPFPEFE